MKSIRTLDVLAGPIKRKNGTTLELPVGQNVYALSQQYGDGIWYRAKIWETTRCRVIGSPERYKATEKLKLVQKI